MCKFASGFFKPDTMEIRLWDLNSYDKTAEHFGIVDSPQPNDWREFHYTPTGEIECRVLDVDAHTKQECESAMWAKWPDFGAFLLALPQKLTETLNLIDVKLPAGLVIPASVTTLYLGWAKVPAGLVIPKRLVIPNTYRAESYRAGLKVGLAVAEKAAGYLTIQPPRKWAEQIRQWVEADIAKAKKQYGL